MTGSIGNNLSREKLQQLLASIGSMQTSSENKNAEFVEYSWNRPHHFNNEQLKKLDNFSKKVGAIIAHKFFDLCQIDFKITITSITQHFAEEIFHNSADQPDHYYLAFAQGSELPCQAIEIPTKTAFLWTIPLLGNTGTTEETPENLTPLEEALLLDIASTLVKALADLHDSFDFNPAENLDKGLLPLYLDSTDELCRIAFNAQQADSGNSSDAYILLPCKMLEPVVGKTVNTEDKYSPEKISRAILEDFQKTNITVTGQLDSIMLTFEEIVSLQPDDILLLDKKIDEPLDVVVDGVTVLRGSLAKSTGKYAAVIKEFCKPIQEINNIHGTLT